jgi:hypothetical protein
VTFANEDGEWNLHEFVVSPPTGFRCPAEAGVSVLLSHDAAGFDVRRGESTTCVFGVARKYVVRDYNLKTPAFRATIAVRPAPAAQRVRVHVAPRVVGYGRDATLSGRASAGAQVDIYEFACTAGAPPRIATVTADATGAFDASVRPDRNTTYQAEVPSTYIADTAVAVRPQVKLATAGRQRFEVRVRAKENFPRRVVLFQRYREGRWLTLKRVRLVRFTVEPTGAISVASFRSNVPRAARVRAFFPAQGCYAAGWSQTTSLGH